MQEPGFRRRRAWCNLADDRTDLDDAGDERGVRRGIRTFDATCQHGDSGGTGGERTAVSCGVDAERSARDDREPAPAEPRSHFGPLDLAVRRGAAGSHNGSTALTGRRDVNRAADPEAVGRCTQIVEAGRPLGVAWADDAGTELGAHLKVSFHIENLETRQEALPTLLCARGCQRQGGSRAMQANQLGGQLVPRLCHTTPRRSRKSLLRQQAAAQGHIHAATTDWARRVRASPTSPRSGVPPPARSVTVHATFRTRSYPRRVKVPRSRARSRSTVAATGSFRKPSRIIG